MTSPLFWSIILVVFIAVVLYIANQLNVKDDTRGLVLTTDEKERLKNINFWEKETQRLNRRFEQIERSGALNNYKLKPIAERHLLEIGDQLKHAQDALESLI